MAVAEGTGPVGRSCSCSAITVSAWRSSVPLLLAGYSSRRDARQRYRNVGQTTGLHSLHYSRLASLVVVASHVRTGRYCTGPLGKEQYPGRCLRYTLDYVSGIPYGTLRYTLRYLTVTLYITLYITQSGYILVHDDQGHGMAVVEG